MSRLFVTPHARRSILAILLLCAAAPAHSQNRALAPLAPQSVLNELLEADRRCSAASAAGSFVTGLSQMLADDVVMPVPGSLFAEGKPKVIETLSGPPYSPTSRVDWTPVRGGLSADGQHGFTLGFMALRQPDGTRIPFKYLSYWVKRPDGWRVIAYKRARRPEGEVSLNLMPPALPTQLVPPSSDPNVIAGFRESLDQAERAFSAEAQLIGLGAAFVKYGTADAINLGGASSPGFVVGSEDIGRTVSVGQPATGSTLSWAPDRVVVASSGDLGVTVGVIHRSAGAPDGAREFPFFTIWRRASVDAPWRYVAE